MRSPPPSRRTHGMTDTPTFRTWDRMVGRCTRQNDTNYHRYGGRGIQICDRWLIFSNFFADMGERPSGLTLDRIDNDKGYEPENCRWAGRGVQARNTRRNRWFEIDGVRRCLKDWCLEKGLDQGTVRARLARGAQIEHALRPARMKRRSVKEPVKDAQQS